MLVTNNACDSACDTYKQGFPQTHAFFIGYICENMSCLQVRCTFYNKKFQNRLLNITNAVIDPSIWKSIIEFKNLIILGTVIFVPTKILLLSGVKDCNYCLNRP